MSPYARQGVTQAEHAWYLTLAGHLAAEAASGLARGCMRRGAAHRYLAAAHLQALFEGAGEEDALAFLDELVEDLRGGSVVRE